MITLSAVWKVVGAKRRIEILRGLDLRVERGEMVALLGPSGAGKTTLLNLIAGVDRPTEGTIMVDGQNLGELSPAALAEFRRDHIGFVFQSFHLLPDLSAKENVALPALLKGENRARAMKRAAECLGWVGMEDRLDHLPEELSGGERQRTAIARALCLNPPVVLADEPTGNLDSATGAEVVNLLLRLQRQLSTTLVVVTHDAGVASRCGRVLHLRDGQLVENAPACSDFPHSAELQGAGTTTNLSEKAP